MIKRGVYLAVLFLLVFLLFGCKAEEPLQEEVVPEKEEVVEEENFSFPPEHEVIFMIPKGDTLTTTFGNEIALIGVKAPTKDEPCFKESINKQKELVLNKNVTLYRDVSDMSYYGQYLRYAFVDNMFVNEEIIRLGFAKAVAEEPNRKYSELLYEAEVDAVSKRMCIWKDLEADPCLFVAFFNYDAEGVDEFNLNDEFVTFRNICKAKIDMTGWKIQNSDKEYVFPEFVLGPEAAVTLHSGQGQDSELHLYWDNEISVWHDYTGTLYLRNAGNDLIIKRRY